MEWFALIIPIVLSLIGLGFFKHKLVWYEIFIPIVASVLFIVTAKSFMIDSLTDDKEYLTSYPVEARYYEDWNEYVSRTCYRTVSCGKNCTTTVAYDCSYVDYHSEYWAMKMNDGSKRSISQDYYNYLKNLWKTPKEFVDLHRDYHTNDGDMYRYRFSGKFEHIEPYVVSHSYENKVQTVNSIMQFRELDTTEVKGLYNYPEVKNYNQRSCLGCTNKENELLEKFNAYLGFKYEVRMYLLIFDHDDIDIAERQQHYWKGGNKNELVVCYNKDNKWVKVFSWVDDKSIEVNVADIFNRDITIEEKIKLMEHEVELHWKRKHFSDFDYIKVPLTKTQMIWLYIVVFLLSIGGLAIGIFNDHDPEDVY